MSAWFFIGLGEESKKATNDTEHEDKNIELSGCRWLDAVFGSQCFSPGFALEWHDEQHRLERSDQLESHGSAN